MTHTTTCYTTVEYLCECTAECLDYLGGNFISELTKSKNKPSVSHL